MAQKDWSEAKKGELADRAKVLDIEGRSGMNVDELRQAVIDAEARLRGEPVPGTVAANQGAQRGEGVEVEGLQVLPGARDEIYGTDDPSYGNSAQQPIYVPPAEAARDPRLARGIQGLVYDQDRNVTILYDWATGQVLRQSGYAGATDSPDRVVIQAEVARLDPQKIAQPVEKENDDD
jgi:hypothetical protein